GGGRGGVCGGGVVLRGGGGPGRGGGGLAGEGWGGMGGVGVTLGGEGGRGGGMGRGRPEHTPEAMGRPPRVDGHGGEVYVYRRAGQPCLVCGTPVRTVELASRNLFWCPGCQPPAPED